MNIENSVKTCERSDSTAFYSLDKLRREEAVVAVMRHSLHRAKKVKQAVSLLCVEGHATVANHSRELPTISKLTVCFTKEGRA